MSSYGHNLLPAMLWLGVMAAMLGITTQEQGLLPHGEKCVPTVTTILGHGREREAKSASEQVRS